MRRLLFCVTVAAGACLGASPAASADAAQAGESWAKAITLNAFAEATYNYNFNDPDSGEQTLRVFDLYDRELRLDVAELVVQRPVAQRGEFGFRVDATIGQTVPKVAASYGLFRNTTTGEAHNYDVHQVFLSWIVPVGKGLRIDGGKFVTPFGYEVVEGYDGYNDNQTRSLLFGYAIPFTHTGLRASYPFSDAISGTVLAVQGWDDWRDNNSAKSVGVQLALTPSKKWTVYLTGMGGPEQPDDNRDNRFLYNATATYKPINNVTLGLDVVVGSEQGLPGPGETARWSGAASYVRWDISDRFSMAFRAEVFDDPDGARTGVSQDLREITITPAFKLGPHFVLRGDLRHDGSDQRVFQDRSDPASGQTTATAAILFIY